MMRIAIVSFTQTGRLLGDRCAYLMRGSGYAAEHFPSSEMGEKVSVWTGHAFEEYDALIYIGAAAIAVRSIAPYLKDKFTDPAVLVVDEKGQYVIPVLSGHVGGANELSAELADQLGAVPVITTATDIQGLFAVDVFAVKNKLILTDRCKAKQVSADILKRETLAVYAETGIQWDKKALPSCLKAADRRETARISIDYGIYKEESAGDVRTLHLVPERALWIGIGCKRETSAAAIETALRQLMTDYHICPAAVAGMASIDVKADEKGIQSVCKNHGWPFITFPAEKLRELQGEFSASEFVQHQVGVDNVCERSAVCAAGADSRLLIRKQIMPGITLAVAGESRRIGFE